MYYNVTIHNRSFSHHTWITCGRQGQSLAQSLVLALFTPTSHQICIRTGIFLQKQAGNEVTDISRAVDPGQFREGGEDVSNNLPQPHITTILSSDSASHSIWR